MEAFLDSIVSVSDVRLLEYSQAMSEFEIVVNGPVDQILQAINLMDARFHRNSGCLLLRDRLKHRFIVGMRAADVTTAITVSRTVAG